MFEWAVNNLKWSVFCPISQSNLKKKIIIIILISFQRFKLHTILFLLLPQEHRAQCSSSFTSNPIPTSHANPFVHTQFVKWILLFTKPPNLPQILLSFTLPFCFLIKPRCKTQLYTQERSKHQLYVQEEAKGEMGLKDQQGLYSNW